MLLSYTPWKHQKISYFSCFWGGRGGCYKWNIDLKWVNPFRWSLWLNLCFMKSDVGKPFLDGGPYHIETSPLICTANQWTGFCMIGTSVMKKLNSIFDINLAKNILRSINKLVTDREWNDWMSSSFEAIFAKEKCRMIFNMFLVSHVNYLTLLCTITFVKAHENSQFIFLTCRLRFFILWRTSKESFSLL